jgi:DNA-binding transcriptional ArsR family regulator
MRIYNSWHKPCVTAEGDDPVVRREAARALRILDVRITYSKNTVRGQWRAHGRYLERESAARADRGFNARESDAQVSRMLQDWQANKDQLLWKFIISPEFGEHTDLHRLTRDMEDDLGSSLEWVAVVHRNTEHPHVHVALRGLSAAGEALRLSRDYVKRGVCEIAEDLSTRQMGFRTALDAVEAERREIPETRFTSLDRVILRNAPAVENGFSFRQTADAGGAQNDNVSARLIALSGMGLVKRAKDGSWLLRSDMEQVLRAMQRAGDRQKTLSAHGELVSDKRLAVEAVDWQQIAKVEGRVLVHGEEENFGKNYLLLESTAETWRRVAALEDSRAILSFGYGTAPGTGGSGSKLRTLATRRQS